MHDVLHGVWHFDKGLLFTMKEAIFRPGKAALDYISGKRVRYYNVFYLSLLLIALNLLLNHFYDSWIGETHTEVDQDKVSAFFLQYVKLILFAFIPVLALNAQLLFRRFRLNWAEQLILAGINYIGILLLALFFFLFRTLTEMAVAEGFSSVMKAAFGFAMFLFPIWTYFNASRGFYSIWQFTWRIIAFYILVAVEFTAFLFGLLHFFDQSGFTVNI